MPFNLKSSLGDLMNNFPASGVVEWVGVRPRRRENLVSMLEVEATAGDGLAGDHYAGGKGPRQVTFIQYEHLSVVASIMNIKGIHPSVVRRNIAVKGINLVSLKEKRFRIGEAIFEMSGMCHPCSRMEEILGKGGYNAMRGHGGITARIIQSGFIKVGDPVVPIEV